MRSLNFMSAPFVSYMQSVHARQSVKEGSTSLIRFILYSRSYCHLCDDLLQALNKLRGEFDFVVDVLDVDADPNLLQLYDELVPVLAGIPQGQEAVVLCHYHLDEDAVRNFLNDNKI